MLPGADADEPVDLSQPFTLAAARKMGLSKRELYSDSYVRLFQGVYVSRRTTRTLALRARGALVVAPKPSVVSHQTAATLWGGHAAQSPMIHLSMPVKVNCIREGIQVHRLLRPPSPTTWLGLPVTSPERTFCDLAGSLRLVELVALGDRLVRRERTTPERLRVAAMNWPGYHQQLIGRAAGLVRAGVDSRPESHLRMLMVLAGMPEPQTAVPLVNAVTGKVERYLDTGWSELRLAIEYDGSQHREDEEIYESDILRHEEVREQRDWRIVRVTKAMYDAPYPTLLRIHNARVERGASPVLLREEWQRYFTGRIR